MFFTENCNTCGSSKLAMICDDTDTPSCHVIYNNVSLAKLQLCFNHMTALSADL